MEKDERLSFFAEMVGACHNLYFWSYDRDMTLISSNCPLELGMEALLSMDGMKPRILVYAGENDTPIILENSISFLWIAAPDKADGALSGIRMLGPFFLNEASRKNVEAHLSTLQLSASLKAEITEFVRSLPIISLNRVFEYCVMLHFAITGEKISPSALHYEAGSVPHEESGYSNERPIHGTYEAEREMLRKVREGDMSFIEEIAKLATTGTLGTLAVGDTLRQYKNAVLVAVTLISRAAIEGGLNAETAMTMTDHYFQRVEAASSIAELTDVSLLMQRDFVERVHRAKENADYSKAVRAAISYIELHIEEPISFSALAEGHGYTEYYLSKKFKAETGKTVKEFISEKRVERAKFLLTETQLSLHDISEKLRYSSQSYFTEQFRKAVGESPAKYRESHQHI